jgi:hypothetical protein
MADNAPKLLLRSEDSHGHVAIVELTGAGAAGEAVAEMVFKSCPSASRGASRAGLLHRAGLI